LLCFRLTFRALLLRWSGHPKDLVLSFKLGDAGTEHLRISLLLAVLVFQGHHLPAGGLAIGHQSGHVHMHGSDAAGQIAHRLIEKNRSTVRSKDNRAFPLSTQFV